MVMQAAFWQEKLGFNRVFDPALLLPPSSAAVESWQALNLIAGTISPDPSPGADLDMAVAVIWPDMPTDNAAMMAVRTEYAAHVYCHTFTARVAGHGAGADFAPGMALMVDLCAIRAMDRLVMRGESALPEPDDLVGFGWHRALQKVITPAPHVLFEPQLAQSAISYGEYLALKDMFVVSDAERGNLIDLVPKIADQAAQSSHLYPALLARDWLDALHRHLPENVLPTKVVQDGLDRLARGTQAAALEKEFPPVSALLIAVARTFGPHGPDTPAIAKYGIK